MSDPSTPIGVIFAVTIEADAFARLASPRREIRAVDLVIHEGVVAGVPVAWCVAGMGELAARRAARLLLAGHAPRLLVSAGFAGGLDPRLARGIVVRPERALTPTGDPIDLAHGLPAAGAIVTVGNVVTTASAKRRLAGDTGARLVDMETHAVAAEGRAAGVPCAAVRVVSDTCGDDLPDEVARLAEPRSNWSRLGSVVGMIGRRPRLALDLWKLSEHGVLDGRSLATALAEFCAGLPGRR
jgi:adenosylhomocysteine nucleosidase